MFKSFKKAQNSMPYKDSRVKRTLLMLLSRTTNNYGLPLLPTLIRNMMVPKYHGGQAVVLRYLYTCSKKWRNFVSPKTLCF